MKNSNQNILLFIFALVIFILTFPSFNISGYSGLDASYYWALNYFFSEERQIFNHLIYPIGPLGFLKSPFFIGNNFLYGLIFFSLVRLFFISFLLILTQKENLRIIYILGITFLILLFSNFDNSIIGLVLTGILLYHKTEKFPYLLVSIIFSTISVYIKSSLGLVCFSIVFIYSIYQLFNKKYYLLVLWFVVLSILGIILTGNLNAYILFIFSTGKMIFGYTAALSLFPDNNWIFLGLSITSFLTIPFLIRKKEIRLIYILMIFASFASWKHAMVREDIYHNRIFLYYLIFLFGIVTIYIHRKILWIVIPMIFSIFFFSLNMKTISGYNQPISISNGAGNFYDNVINIKSFKQKSDIAVLESFKSSLIDDSTLKIIDRRTIDIFPWELSYIPSNNLNWKPRPTLQSGAYSQWIDSISASYFMSKTGPDFILFHQITCPNYTKMGSLDGRYILNDEPISIFQILSNYKICKINENNILFSKLSEPQFLKPESIKKECRLLKEWINVPDFKDEILRVKFNYSKKIFAKLKEFFYKGEYFQIEYKLINNKIFTYRFNPETAISGLWINPFIIEINKSSQEVKEIRFSCSSPRLIEQEITLEWEIVNLKNDTQNQIFTKPPKKINNSLIYNSKNDFENYCPNWKVEKNKLDSIKVYSGKFSNHVKKNEFSASFNFPVDSLLSESGQVEFFASCQVFLNKKTNALFVLSIEDENGSKFWTSKPLDKLFVGNWNENQFRSIIDISQFKGLILNFYIWNPKGDECWIDEFAITTNSTK